MASFIRQIQSDLIAEDGLLVSAKGLAMHEILCWLVEKHHDSTHLVFVLNSTRQEERQLSHRLALKGSMPALVAITNECSAHDRVELYATGGVLLVTARIMVVDMLCGRVPLERTTGLIVCNAHRVSESSNVAFIVRLFREKSPSGFIKALSDDAHGFTRGFARVEKAMRILCLQRLHLWPRFRLDVNRELDACQPDVEEFRVPLTKSETRLQRALLSAVDTCLQELRSLNQSLDLPLWTVENSLFKSFDTLVRMQLEPVWSKASKKTKALVSDLQTLRKVRNNSMCVFSCSAVLLHFVPLRIQLTSCVSADTMPFDPHCRDSSLLVWSRTIAFLSLNT